MDNRAQAREFLASRRARITPGRVGLPAYGGNRRVKGLRREEVALLAGRFIYLDPAAREFFVDYDRMATDAAAMLRLEAERNPHDKALVTLVGELSTQSELFRQHWASRNVKFHRSGRKRLRHPAVGELDLNFEALELPSEPDLRLNLYTAGPDTPAADGLKLLASWAATRAVDNTGTRDAHDVR